jgi:precorrin-4/cobalt-precorrin-4 C11-methyltransferase
MKVYFIGAGPGAADLITLRGAAILGRVNMVLYAGSLVSRDMLAHCHADAEIIDTAHLDLEQQEACYRRAQAQGIDVARLHSGDPAIYGATAEQMRRLDALGIAYEIVPGVSSFTAAAASIKAELTKPEVSQSIILTRVSGRASAVPESESIALLAVHGATMCIFLSGPHLKKIHQSTLGQLLAEIKTSDWNLTTMLLVGEALSNRLPAESRLYAKDYAHIFRVVKKPKTS